MLEQLASSLGLRYELVEIRPQGNMTLARAEDVPSLETYAALPSLAGRTLDIIDRETGRAVPAWKRPTDKP